MKKLTDLVAPAVGGVTELHKLMLALYAAVDAMPEPGSPPPNVPVLKRRAPVGNYYRPGVGSSVASIFKRLDSVPHFDGVTLDDTWGELERAPGVYDFSRPREVAQGCLTRGMAMWWRPEYKVFNDKGTLPVGITSTKITHNSLTANIWEPEVFRRLLRLYLAAGKALGPHRGLCGVDLTESAPGDLPPEVDKILPATLREIYDWVPLCFPEVWCFANINFFYGDAPARALRDDAIARNLGIASTDMIETEANEDLPAGVPLIGQISLSAVKKGGYTLAVPFKIAQDRKAQAVSWLDYLEPPCDWESVKTFTKDPKNKLPPRAA